ncbi:hypothetical protein FBUS_02114 [Fasciolopsis buskii]|uniref:EGF-like domain-containing protein n=1 Tax=Fasciolopsis buskii TaxID=27845 RepID=A0A8E0S316_9TREM|nr:hypothetical protein FBUS_02114 [Fasciolopsis buski]
MILFAGLFLMLSHGICATDIELNDIYISLPNNVYLGLENKVIVRTTHANTRVTLSTTKYRLDKVFEDPKVYQVEQLTCGWYAVEIPYRVPFLVLEESMAGSITINFTVQICSTHTCDTSKSHSLAESYQVLQPPFNLLGETDKPLYRPGETVRFRFIALIAELLWPNSGPLKYPSEKLVELPGSNRLHLEPVTEEDKELISARTNPVFEEIVIHDPSDTRVKQWLNISPKDAFSLNYTLLSDAPNGKWKAKARLRALPPVITELEFNVKQYVLPRFTVSMIQPEDLTFESTQTQFSVCAQYTNGPPMIGTVRAHLCVCSRVNIQNPSDQQITLEEQACTTNTWHPERRPCLPVSGLLSSSDGCASFNVSTKLLDLSNMAYPTWDQISVICAHVEEQGTGSNVSRCDPGTRVIQHNRARFELKSPGVFKPGLPVVGSVRLVHPDLVSFENVAVRLLVEETVPRCFFGFYPRHRVHQDKKYRFTKMLTVDSSGRADFQIPPINAKRSVLLTVSYQPGVSDSPETNAVPALSFIVPPRWRPPKPQEGVTAQQTVEKWLAPQDKSMIVWPSPDAIQVTCPGIAQFQLLANTPLQDKVIHVQGIIRGKHFHHVISATTNPDLCRDRDDELGHYQCLRPQDSNEIECLPGWTGDDCLVPVCEKQTCHRPGGVCSGPEQCTCFRYWSGAGCDVCTERRECGRADVQVEELGNSFDEMHPSGKQGTSQSSTEVASTTVTTEEQISTAWYAPKRTLHLRNVSFPVDGNWGPEATVVVFFLIKDNSSSGIIPVTIKLQNMSTCVSPATAMESTQTENGLRLDNNRVSPGQKIDLTLVPQGIEKPTDDDETNDNQYCFVRMQDKSLDNFEGNKNLVDLNALSQLLTTEPKYYDSSEPSSLVNSFRAAGLRLISNIHIDLIEPIPCPIAYSVEQRRVNMVMDSDQGVFGKAEARMAPLAKTSDTMIPKPFPKPRLRDFFPEVWLFSYYRIQWSDATEQPEKQNTTVTTGGYIRQALTVPDTITSWRANAFCTTKSNGLWIPKPVEMITSMPVFAEITLPNHLKRGEILYLPMSVFAAPTNESGLTDCMTVSVIAQLNKDDWAVIGAQSFTDCLCPGNKKTFRLGLLAKRLGMLNVTVEAYGREKTELCTDEIRAETDDRAGKSRTFSDLLRRAIKVEPEGVRRDLSQGDILCLTKKKLSVKADYPILWPDHSTYVSDSLRVYLAYTDEVLGPALANLDQLVRLPVGCGEQNMVLVAPNVYVLDYLNSVEATGNSRGLDNLKRDAKKHILTGYQRQLGYRHDDGSYSAFGKSDSVGSTWLTAFVLRVFAKAYKVDRSIQVEWSTLFAETAQFLKTRQNKDSGCFVEQGRVLHTGMQGGAGVGSKKEKEMLLTTYILSAILETRPDNGTDYSPEFSQVIDNAVRCLRNKHGLGNTEEIRQLNTYALAQLAYATVLLGPNENQTVVMKQELERRKQEHSPGGLSQNLQYWRALETLDNKPDVDINALDVETTSYALLTFAKTTQSENQLLFPVVRWLSSQQKREGGFFSTQDTVMALEAIAQFAKRIGISGTPPSNSTLEIEAIIQPVGFKFAQSMTSEKRHVLNQFSVPGDLVPKDIRQISWTLSSLEPLDGCVTVHCSLIYHEQEGEKSRDDVFHMTKLIEQPQEPPANACTAATLSICLMPNKESPEETGMLLITVNMVTGWKPIPQVIVKQISGNSDGPKQIEFSPDDSTVSAYFDGFSREHEEASGRIEEQKRCVKLTLIQSVYVKNAKPAVIAAIDYYSNNRRVSTSYTLDECPGAWKLDKDAYSTPSTTGPTALSSTESFALRCPICILSPEMNQTLMNKLSSHVCHGWSNLFGVKVHTQVQANLYNVTLNEIDFTRSISSWNATLVVPTSVDCTCTSLTAPATLLWLSPNSRLQVDPGDPEVSILSMDPEALLIPVEAAWPAIQRAREHWKSDQTTQSMTTTTTTTDLEAQQFTTCYRVEVLWRFIKANLI